jgi:hypothetical protein
MHSRIALALVLVTSTLAIPLVTPKELPATCSSYPKYNADTDIAGPWQLEVVHSDNPAIEGFGDSRVYSISYDPNTDRKPTLRWGYVSEFNKLPTDEPIHR